MAKLPEVKSVIKAELLSGPLKDCMYYFPFQNKSCASYTEESEKATHRKQPRVLICLGFFECFLFVFKDWYIQTINLSYQMYKFPFNPSHYLNFIPSHSPSCPILSRSHLFSLPNITTNFKLLIKTPHALLGVPEDIQQESFRFSILVAVASVKVDNGALKVRRDLGQGAQLYQIQEIQVLQPPRSFSFRFSRVKAASELFHIWSPAGLPPRFYTEKGKGGGRGSKRDPFRT